MPAFKVNVPHPLSQQDAVDRLKPFVEKITERYKGQVSHSDGSWVDNVLNFTLTTFGFTITGKLAVEESAVQLEGQLPFAALPFRGKIEESIAAELRRELQG